MAFAAQGRIWALDPSTGALSCVLEGPAPGPFLWGPQGDRVLLRDFQVAGWHDSPSSTALQIEPAIADWGHPIGIAIVFALAGEHHLWKHFLESGETETLRDLPAGTYLDVTYHPTGLALAFILERHGAQSIWFSTNEGTQPKRLVFTEAGTTFSDVTFTPDGGSIVFVAHHATGGSEIHRIDLAEPDKLATVWKGAGEHAPRTVIPSPQGLRFISTEGTSCSRSRAALLLGSVGERVLAPGVEGPTTALGWLDLDTVLVGAGGCGAPMDLYAVTVTGSDAPRLLVTGVGAGASRAPAPPGPELPKEVQLDTGSGIG